MKLTKDLVQHVALLARLELSDTELELFTEQLGRIMEYMDKLNELNTEGVPPTFHVLQELQNVFREDQPRCGLKREEALAQAPDVEGNCFKVPPVIERS